MTMDKKADYAKGVECFETRYLPHRRPLLEELQQFSPELADVVIRHGLYEIWEEKTPSLTYREKEIATLAALITGNTVMKQVMAHTENCLIDGMSKQQIIDILVLLSLYIGVPKIINSIEVIKQAFSNYDDFVKNKK